MNKLLTHPLFLAGLAIRLAMIALVLPLAEVNWYLPFMDLSTSAPTIDPWQLFLDNGGNPAAFPYGYMMWLVFLPLTLVGKLVGLPLHLGYSLTLLAADFCLLAILRRALPAMREQSLLLIYWLSPIVLLATYWLGLNDLIPVTLLCLALCFTKDLRLFPAGIACAAAVSAKLSMVVAIPFFLIYLFRNRALRQLLPEFIKGLALAVAIFLLPFAMSAAGMHMLFGNPEMGKVYQFALSVGRNTFIYILPMTYLLMLYTAWRIRRLNFELFNALLAVAFLCVVLMTPASPGWFVWLLPMLAFYQATSNRVAMIAVALFSALYAVDNLLVVPWPTLALAAPFSDQVALAIGQSGSRLVSLVHTLVVVAGVVLAVRIWREAIASNDYFRLSRKPFVIGIAGDSGAGKDTLAESLTGLFGTHSVARLSGDDYHLWDRQKPMWQVMTHLNPMANDLEGFASDLVALTDGKAIVSRHYDHDTGKMSHERNIRSNDFIIASGLHALYQPILRNCYNLTIFLDMDEGLRKHLKLTRDTIERGHSTERVIAAMEKRAPDANRFIRPQAAHADLVMSLQPIHPRIIEDANGKHPLRFKLLVRSRSGLNELSLTRVLVGVCGLHVDMEAGDDSGVIELTIEGDTSADDIAQAAGILFPRILQFLDVRPRWQDGVPGLMQLIVLSHINQALNKRLLW